MRRALLPCLASLACGPGVLVIDVPEPVFDYDLEHVIQVDITLDDDDWQDLRHQQRNLLDLITGEDCLEEPFDSPYAWFSATVSIDGVVLDDVAVRKKGLIGSVTPARPSLKLKFDKYVDDQIWLGRERLTLNNGRQDPSRIKQCLGYSLYQDAGMAASRCSFAHVLVNGEDLGVYSNIEPVKKAMLARHFDSPDGNLYEGALSDFREGWLGSFDDKTERGDGGDLRAIAEALTVPENELEAALDKVIDVDQYLQSWAMEVLLAHNDGYAGNRNNYYVYADPSDGRFHFMPWGIDNILEGETPFGEGQPVAVVANAVIPYRALRNATLKGRYIDALRGKLDQIWDEDELAQRVDHMKQLTAPYAWRGGDDEGRYAASIAGMHMFIAGRREGIERELDRGWDEVPGHLGDGTPCLVERGHADVRFDTTWGSNERGAPWDIGAANMAVTFDGNELPVESLGSTAGVGKEGRVLLVSGQLPDGTGLLIWMVALNDRVFAEAGEYDASWQDVQAYLLVDNDGGHDSYSVGAYLGGAMTLDETSLEPGARVAGGLDLVIWGGQQ
ncbi:MAG: spore coat protein CotH [Kiritimatiellia bacterium]|jgi:spore coat protein CotH